MTPESAALLADYNRWMNRRMYEAALKLPEGGATQDRGAFFGSLQATLNHVAVGDTIWLHRFALHPDAATLRADLQPFAPPKSLRQVLAPSLADLQAYRAALDEIIVRWARALTPGQLAATVSYRNMAGQPQARRLGHLVLHFFNHQTHHRGQASTLLFQAGVDIGVTDLLALVPGVD